MFHYFILCAQNLVNNQFQNNLIMESTNILILLIFMRPLTPSPKILPPPPLAKNQAGCATGFEFRITNLANNNQ